MSSHKIVDAYAQDILSSIGLSVADFGRHWGEGLRDEWDNSYGDIDHLLSVANIVQQGLSLGWNVDVVDLDEIKKIVDLVSDERIEEADDLMHKIADAQLQMSDDGDGEETEGASETGSEDSLNSKDDMCQASSDKDGPRRLSAFFGCPSSESDVDMDETHRVEAPDTIKQGNVEQSSEHGSSADNTVEDNDERMNEANNANRADEADNEVNARYEQLPDLVEKGPSDQKALLLLEPFLGAPHIGEIRVVKHERDLQDQMIVFFPEGPRLVPTWTVNLTVEQKYNLPDLPCAFIHLAQLYVVRLGYNKMWTSLIQDQVRRTSPRIKVSHQPCVREIALLANIAMKGQPLPYLPRLLDAEAYLCHVLFVHNGKLDIVKKHFTALKLEVMLDYDERFIIDRAAKQVRVASTGETLPVSLDMPPMRSRSSRPRVNKKAETLRKKLLRTELHVFVGKTPDGRKLYRTFHDTFVQNKAAIEELYKVRSDVLTAREFAHHQGRQALKPSELYEEDEPSDSEDKSSLA